MARRSIRSRSGRPGDADRAAPPDAFANGVTNRWRPAKATVASASKPTEPDGFEPAGATARPASSAVLPTPGSPRITSEPPIPLRALLINPARLRLGSSRPSSSIGPSALATAPALAQTEPIHDGAGRGAATVQTTTGPPLVGWVGCEPTRSASRGAASTSATGQMTHRQPPRGDILAESRGARQHRIRRPWSEAPCGGRIFSVPLPVRDVYRLSSVPVSDSDVSEPLSAAVGGRRAEQEGTMGEGTTATVGGLVTRGPRRAGRRPSPFRGWGRGVGRSHGVRPCPFPSSVSPRPSPRPHAFAAPDEPCVAVNSVLPATKSAREATAAKAAAQWFPADQVAMATAVAGAESSWNPTAVNKAARGNYGLWQINSVHDRLLDAKNWRDPGGQRLDGLPGLGRRRRQAKGNGRGSWKPWSVYNSGSYKSYLRESAPVTDQAVRLRRGAGRRRDPRRHLERAVQQLQGPDRRAASGS